jgi:hypothetical protein
LVAFFFWKNRQRSKEQTEGTTSIQLSDAGFSVGTDKAQAAVPWSHFAKCIETENLFLLVERVHQTTFIIPNRVFPDDNALKWFRAHAIPGMLRPAPVPPGPLTLLADSDQSPLVLRYQLGFRDYLDRALASWRTWGFLLVVCGLVIGFTCYAALNPLPQRDHRARHASMRFENLGPLLLPAFAVVLILWGTWRSFSKKLVPVEVKMTESALEISSGGGFETGPWSIYTSFKESRRSFILWHRTTKAWLLLPKRALRSDQDIAACRSLISRNLRASRWYLG